MAFKKNKTKIEETGLSNESCESSRFRIDNPSNDFIKRASKSL